MAFPQLWFLLVERRAEQGWVWVEVGVDVGSGLQPLLCGGEIKEASASLSASCRSSRPLNLMLIYTQDQETSGGSGHLVTPSELGVHRQRRSNCSGCPYTYVPPHPSGAGHILFSLACASNQRHVHGAQNGCLPVCGLYTQAFASTISLLALLAVSKGTHYCLCFTVEEIKD